MNPGWEILMLSARSIWDFLGVDGLPRQWEEMYIAWQADAVRLALLAKYGGLWIDAATICVKPFDWWLYDAIADEGRVEGLGSFYFAAWGVEMHQSTEYVENWVMAARRQHPLIVAWKQAFN